AAAPAVPASGSAAVPGAASELDDSPGGWATTSAADSVRSPPHHRHLMASSRISSAQYGHRFMRGIEAHRARRRETPNVLPRGDGPCGRYPCAIRGSSVPGSPHPAASGKDAGAEAAVRPERDRTEVG